jgi:hypothetical protein
MQTVDMITAKLKRKVKRAHKERAQLIDRVKEQQLQKLAARGSSPNELEYKQAIEAGAVKAHAKNDRQAARLVNKTALASKPGPGRVTSRIVSKPVQVGGGMGKASGAVTSKVSVKLKSKSKAKAKGKPRRHGVRYFGNGVIKRYR